MDGPPFTPAGENVSAIDRVKAMFDFKDDAESVSYSTKPLKTTVRVILINLIYLILV